MSLLTKIASVAAIPLLAGSAAVTSNTASNTNSGSGRHDDLVQQIQFAEDNNSAADVSAGLPSGFDDIAASLEVETEHGITTLVPHNRNDNSSSVGVNSQVSLDDDSNGTEGFEVEVEHGVTTLVPHGGNDSTASTPSTDDSQVAEDNSGRESSGRNNNEVVHEQNRRGRGSN